MITLEEIKNLAEQYAEFTDGSPADKAYIRAITQCFTEGLCKTHCIVPKSKVIGLWNEINNDAKINIENGFPDYAEFNKLQLTPIEILFGKELFNKEKE